MSTRVNRIAVITRLHYTKDDPRFLPRLKMFENYALASLKAQTDQDFDICVWAEPWHKEQVEALDPRIKVFNAEWRKREGEGVHKYFIDYTTFDKVSGLAPYVTVIGLDSDDELDPRGIETVRELSNGTRKAISFQPVKRDLTTGVRYKMKSYRHRHKMSPIFALHQPDEPYLFAYQYGHYSEMPNQFKVIIYIPEGETYLNVHDFNASTKVTKEDQKL